MKQRPLAVDRPRPRLILVAALLALPWASTRGDEGRAGADAPPNIVLIVADDLGWGHLGCYGQEKIETPSIDRLAREGMRFTQFYSGSCVCAPARSVLMTGLHTGHTPIRANGGGNSLDDADVTVAEVLERADYATGGFGKWGLGLAGTPGHPNRQGFDEWVGYYHQVHAHFFHPWFIWRNDEKLLLPGNEEGRRGQYSADVIHSRALDFVRRSVEKKERFFSYVPSTLPHVELVVPEDSEAPYRGRWPRVAIADPRAGYIGSDDAYVTYAGMISRLDRQVGEVLALLDELGIAEETLVIFTSDNGPQGGPWSPLLEFFDGTGGLRGTKGTLWEGGIRAPFIARWPGRVAAGAVSEHVAAFQDILPTCAELAGVEAPAGIDGISFAPALLGKEGQKEHAHLYWEHGLPRPEQAIRKGRWKARRARPDRPWTLHDLVEDPTETRDVAAEHPDVLREIERIAASARTNPRPQPPGERVGVKDYVR